MTPDITELTPEKLEEIRQRYRPTEVPKCHICGSEMTIQHMAASRITYGCAGAIYDETGCHYAEGRSLADDHYAESRITVVDVSDPDVLALVEALEKAQQVDEELCKLLPPGAEYMDPPDGGDVTPLEGVRRMVADYRQRIAELESRTVKLPPCVDDLHGIGMVMSADAVVEALTSYGIKVEAE
ncbi:ead/Ea22-like family protein [Klebsiella quasipneumoniae]